VVDKGSPGTPNLQAVIPSLRGDSGGDHEDNNAGVQASREEVVDPPLPILWGTLAHVVQVLFPVGNLSGGHRHNVDTWPIKGDPRGKSLQGSGALFPWPSQPDHGRGGVGSPALQ
jgi:hypothetical protein